ncbi:ATP-dependent helicase, partial [Enterococcus faecium]
NLSVEEMVQLVKEKYDSIDKNARQPISERLYGLLTELQEQKRSQQLLEFNDVLQNLKSALENEEIQHYIGQKYDYLFIDEFQDTNPLQWEIVKRMTKENRIKLIVVGDDDQSIYGFRGSEPAYIKNFEKEYPTKTLFLLTNYRSRAAIVQGANRLISYNKNDRIPKAMIPAQKEAGVMEAYLFSDTKAESQWLIKQIQTFIQKNGKYKESIILYRSASQTQQLVQSLLKTNIPFVLEADSPYEGIFGIKSFQHFYQKIVHWQTALNLQKKNQAYQQLLRQLMADCYLKKSECDQYFSPKYQNIAVADYILSISPNLKSKSAEIREFEEALRKTDQHQEIYSLVQSYLHLPRIAKEIDQSDQEWIREEVKQHATFRRLQALSQETQATAKELKTRLIAYRQGKLDALCIQSIHKSKGLSYRNVFLIGCNEGSLPYNGATEKKVIDFNEIKAEPVTTIEEERRLFYVAMTRARNRLYLCVPQMKNSRKLKVSRFIKETGSRVKKGK